MACFELLRRFDDRDHSGSNEIAAFNTLVEKLINDPADINVKVPGARPEKVQVFSTKKYGIKELTEERKKKQIWLDRLTEKRNKAKV
jgi:hypothetical protein